MLSAALFLHAVPAPAQDRPAAASLDRAVAFVGESLITLRDVDFLVFEQRLKQSELWQVDIDRLRRELLPRLVEEHLLYRHFWRPGAEVPDEEMVAAVQAEWTEWTEAAGSAVALGEALRRSDLLADEARRFLEDRAGRQWLIRGRLMEGMDPALFGQDNPSEADRYGLGQILFLESADEDRGVSARERAAQARYEISRGMEFPVAARVFSDDPPARDTGGASGWFDASDLAPAVRSALREMKPGEVSRPIEVAGGWVIVRLQAYDTPARRAFTEAYRKRRSELLETARKQTEVRFSQAFM
ncbi:MAG: peptidylprolyl isomerase [Sumerlaeia bacterium]